MRVQLTLKNYRCFVSPVTIEIRKGFTAFVGINNAGKSTAMRFLLEFRPVLQAISQKSGVQQSLHSGSTITQLLHVFDMEEVFSNLNAGPIEFLFEFFYDPGESGYKHTHEKFLFTCSRKLNLTSKIFLDGVCITDVNPGNISIHDQKQLLVISNQARCKLTNLYETAGSLANTLYVGPFRNTINVGSRDDYLDIKIGEAFIAQFRDLKTGPNKKANTGISRLTEDIRRVFEFDSLDISPAADGRSLHFTVNNRPFKQHELGSGLSHFIVVLANASVRTPAWVLIDEPELNLHPTLQLDFLTTLGKYASEGVWFSTHSLGLARAAAEQVYSVLREADGDSKVRPFASTPRLSEFLGEMSFSSHKELGFEKVLLVEGPTEVKTVQQFLRMISKDHKVLLLPLHGYLPRADELEEILRITTNVAVLIDSERNFEGVTLSAPRQSFIDLCQSKGLTAHALDRRATENYFPDAAIKFVFGDKYRSLGPFERLAEAQPHWSKSQNWKLAAAMKFDDIRNTDLGAFLEAL
jgi:predicted ATPase